MNFTACYQQFGDFQVTKVNGQVQKNGGNVVSYFLTPEGRVINAVVGPVSADKLLAEARWAVETYEKACEIGGKDAFAQMDAISQAHAALESDRTHRFLAEKPLAPLPMIQQEVFETLAGQKASQDRSGVALAAARFAQAERQGRPVLLVLSDPILEQIAPLPGVIPSMDILKKQPIAAAVRGCVLVQLPIDELPALTNLVNLPLVDQAGRLTPAMLMTRGDGTPLAAISPNGPPREIALQIWGALNQFRLERAEQLMESGKLSEATSLLKLVKASPFAGPLKEQAVAKLAELQSLAKSHRSKATAPKAVDDRPKKPATTNQGGSPGPRLASYRSDEN
ncbi:MAG TPA: hypothetical protein VHB99_01050 [Pirellulales bacterium]|nr:hypothetical protein [Pirellulales bacterium]